MIHPDEAQAYKSAVQNAILDGRILRGDEPEENPRQGLPKTARPGSHVRRKTNAWYAQQFRDRNRAKGLCPYCGGTPVPGHTRCAGCLQQMRDLTKKRRERFKAAGLCTQCGGQREDPAKNWCDACRENNAHWKKKKTA